MLQKLIFQCSVCNEQYRPDQVTYNCPNDGGNLDVLLDIDKIKTTVTPQDIIASQDFSMWRYLRLLPVQDPGFQGTPLRAVGWTQSYSPTRLAKKTGLNKLWIKDESSNPTASFKDRASALLVAKAHELGAEVIVTASSGNAGAALAGMSAAVGQKSIILVPKNAPPAKIAQLLIYGAEILLVDGTYDDAFDLTLLAAEEFVLYCRNTGYNPFTAEGKKTAGFEIWEQILIQNTFDRPLCVFIAVGDGNIISGIHKGFKDLHALGWLGQMPRLFGVQAEGSAAVAQASQDGVESINAVKATTIADSISVGMPRDGLRALRAATQTDGAYVTVSDKQILAAMVQLGQIGIFAEPAGSASFAGVINALDIGLINKDDPVLALVTGSGLKDAAAATKAVDQAPVIAPTIEALQEALNKR
ncbi:MAG: threonine synthase [Chloroflexota bacterium]